MGSIESILQIEAMFSLNNISNININKKCLSISIQLVQTIVTEFTILNFQNKFSTEFISTLAIILKQLFASGSVKIVE